MCGLPIRKQDAKGTLLGKRESKWLRGLPPTAATFLLLAFSKSLVYVLTLSFFVMAGVRPYLDMFSNWDAGFFIGVAEEGYYSPATFAWPPLFPILIRGLKMITGNFVLAGLLTSNLFSLLQIVPAYKLFSYYTDRPREYVILWMLFPLYFVWGIIPYTEHVFSFFVLCTWWALKKKRRLPSIALGTLAALTRQPGILLFIPLFLYFAIEERGVFSKIIYSMASLLIPLSTLGWYLYAAWLTGDPLAVPHAQKYFGTYFVTDVIGRFDFKSLIESYSFYTVPNHVAMPFLVTFILLSCLLLVPRVHRMDKYMSTYSVVSMGVFLVTLPLTSTLRHLSTLFPLFLIAPLRMNLRLYIAICALSSSLMLYAYMQTIFIG